MIKDECDIDDTREECAQDTEHEGNHQKVFERFELIAASFTDTCTPINALARDIIDCLRMAS